MTDEKVAEDNPFAKTEIKSEEFATAQGMTKEDAIAAGRKMSQQTAVLELHIRQPSFRKKIAPTEFIETIRAIDSSVLTDEMKQHIVNYDGATENSADTSILHVSQDILKCKEISNIAYHAHKFSWLIKREIAIPSPMLANGMFQVRLERISEIDGLLATFRKERKVLIAALRDRYEALKEEAKVRRGPFYNGGDYPEWAEIESRYAVEARYLTFNVPSALESINKEIYAREQEKATLQWADAAQVARDASRTFIQTLGLNFVDMLGVDEETGKRKAFSSVAAKKLMEGLKRFEELDVTDDQALAVHVKKLRDVVSGIDVKELRKDNDLKDTIMAAAKQVTEQMSSLVVVGERKIFFEEDEIAEEDEVLAA